MHDPIDFLKPAPAALEAGHRRRVLDATLAELRRRRGRRTRSVTALLAGLAAAVVLFALVPVTHPEGERPAAPGRAAASPSAEELEWQALEWPEGAKRLYLQAG